LLQTSLSQELTPQIEKGITACKWVRISDLSEYLSETFISIRDLLEEFIDVNALNE
jgi:hypothetical protein|tara:strand:- start:5723 stop:5890 length:168 start_codon:yes stop_codon:yes gene_type:complete